MREEIRGRVSQIAENHQPENRTRKIRTHGSEGGGTAQSTGPSYPYRDSLMQVSHRGTQNRVAFVPKLLHGDFDIRHQRPTWLASDRVDRFGRNL